MFRVEVENKPMEPSNGDEPTYGIEDLALKGGVSRRTVRYYVQRGLLSAPTGTGRGPHYNAEHLATLIQIRQLQEQGVSLSEIPSRLRQGSIDPLQPGPVPFPVPAPYPSPLPQPRWPPPPAVEPARSVWTRIVLSDGVELHVRGRNDPLDSLRLARAVEALRSILGL
jgi:DNA-binding transcriptional MerR regulator